MDIFKINIGRLILALVGQGLIFIFYLLIFPYGFFGGEVSVMWLDLVVTSLVYWIWVLNAGIAPVSKNDPSQKGIGGLGIRLYASTIYSVLAIGFIFIAILLAIDGSPIAFKWQIMVQAIIFFIFLVWMYSANLATRKTEEVYHSETAIKAGKADIRRAISTVLASAEDNGAPADIQERLRTLNGATRFVTPSRSMEAEDADLNILNECSRLSAALMNPGMNRQEIEKGTAQLERYFNRRKQIN